MTDARELLKGTPAEARRPACPSNLCISQSAPLLAWRSVYFAKPQSFDLSQLFPSGLQAISLADLIQLAGAHAVKITGGPSIVVPLGRKDVTVADPPGRIPGESLDGALPAQDSRLWLRALGAFRLDHALRRPQSSLLITMSNGFWRQNIFRSAAVATHNQPLKDLTVAIRFSARAVAHFSSPSRGPAPGALCCHRLWHARAGGAERCTHDWWERFRRSCHVRQRLFPDAAREVRRRRALSAC